jgi:hypothetical protein
MLLQEEREYLSYFRNKLIEGNDLSKEDLINLCDHFDETIEMASVSFKIVERLRTNYSKLQQAQSPKR